MYPETLVAETDGFKRRADECPSRNPSVKMAVELSGVYQPRGLQTSTHEPLLRRPH